MNFELFFSSSPLFKESRKAWPTASSHIHRFLVFWLSHRYWHSHVKVRKSVRHDRDTFIDHKCQQGDEALRSVAVEPIVDGVEAGESV